MLISFADVIRSIFTPAIPRPSVKPKPRLDARAAIKPGGETRTEAESIDKDVIGFLDE